MTDAACLLAQALDLDAEGADNQRRLSAWEAVRAATPGWNPIPSLGLAEVLNQIGYVDAAIAHLTPGLNPWLTLDHADLASQRAECYRQRGQLLEAVAAWEQAVAMRPDAAGYCNLGVAQKNIWDLDAAEEAFRRALAIDPGHALSWCNLGHLLSNRDDVDAARAAYERAQTADPSAQAASWHRAFTALRLVYDDCADVERRRQTYASDLAALVATVDALPARCV